MIQITPHLRVFQYREPVDFRKGIDGLVGLCKNKLKQDPFSGALFIFVNRSYNSFKILTYDSQGFWLCQKRFSTGKIRFWPSSDGVLSGPQLQVLLYNGNPAASNIQPPWRKIDQMPEDFFCDVNQHQAL